MTNPTLFLRSNGLSIAVLARMLVSIAGQILTGHAVDNEELREDGAANRHLIRKNQRKPCEPGHHRMGRFCNPVADPLSTGLYAGAG